MPKDSITGQEIVEEVTQPVVAEDVTTGSLSSEPQNISPVTRDTQGNLSTGFTPLKEETVTDETVIQEPEPVKPVEPKVPETPVQEVKVEEKVEAPKTPATKIETAQDVKGNQLANEEAERQIKEQENAKTVDQFNKALTSGANVDELAKISRNKPELRSDFNSALKSYFKTNKNFNFFKKYNGMSNEQLTTSVNNSDVVIGSDEYKLLPADQRASFEAYYKEATANNTKEDDNAKFESDENKIISNTKEEEQIAQFVGLNVREASKKLFNTPELTNSSTIIRDKKNQINDLNDIIDGISDDVDKAYPTLSGSDKAYIISDRTRKLNKDKNTLINEYNSELGNYQRLKDNANSELELLKYEDAQARDSYNTELNLYETRRKEKRADLAAIQLAEGKEAAAKLKRQQDLEDMVFLEKNKQIAIDKALINDITLADYKNKIAQGIKKGSWEDRYDGLYFLEENGKFTKVIDGGVTENKDGTRTYTSVGEDGSPIFQMYDIKGNAIGANTNFSKLNQKEADLLNTPAGSIIPTRLKTVSDTNTNRGKECAEYMNDIFSKTTGQRMGDTYASKLAVANEKKGNLGSMAVWQPNPGNPSFSKFGHAGVIVGESEDGKSWHIKSSNIKGDGVISVDEVPKDVIDGYRSTGIFETPIEDKQYSTAQEQFLKTVDVTKGTNKEMKATISNLGLTEEDVFAYKSKNVPSKTTKQFETLLTRLNNLKGKDGKFESAEGFNEVVGFGLQKVFDVGEQNFIAGTDAANFAADLDTFLANITIDNLDKMSGVLTDKDLEILKGAGTALSSNLSEKQFIERITELEKVYKKALGQEVIDTKDVIYTDNDGTQYSNDSLKKEILRAIDEGETTAEEVKEWARINNITLK